MGSLGLSDTNLFGMGNIMNFNAGYNKIDLQVLRSSGYAALADSIQAASEIALAAGEKVTIHGKKYTESSLSRVTNLHPTEQYE